MRRSQSGHQRQSEGQGRPARFLRHCEDQWQQDDQGHIEKHRDGRHQPENGHGRPSSTAFPTGQQARRQGPQPAGSFDDGAKQGAQANHHGDEAQRAPHARDQRVKRVTRRHAGRQRGQQGHQDERGKGIHPETQDQHQ